MFAKCNKCGYITPFEISDVKDIDSKVCELDIFGQKKPVKTGVIKCNNCGANIETKTKSQLLKELNNNKYK